MSTGVTTQSLPIWRNPATWTGTADTFVILVALALPWSTSLVAIFVVAWLVTAVPTIDLKSFMQTLKRPICALPIALFGLAAIGTSLVRCALGRPSLRDQPDREAARVTGAILSFPALVARPLGIHRIFGIVHAAAGNVLDRCFQSKSRSEVRG